MYRKVDATDLKTQPLSRRPLAIHVNGNFYFDGRMDISGDDVLTANDRPKARSGGYRGTRKRSSWLRLHDYSERDAGYFIIEVQRRPRYHRFSVDPGTVKDLLYSDRPTDIMYLVRVLV